MAGKRFFFISFFLLFWSASFAQPIHNRVKPKLVVGIVVENMRPDYVDRFWDKFKDGGFKKLYNEGAVCNNFKIEQHIQSYATGTATLFTGVYPATHGIICPVWFDRLTEKEVNCVEDANYFTVGADTKAGNASAAKLLSNTFGDNLKVFSRGKSKVFSVALNDASAIFSAGHAANGAYWFDPESGRMVSSSYYISTFPDWVRIFNSGNYAENYTYHNWTTLLPLITYEGSVQDDYLLEKGYFGEWNTFPHVISKYVKRAGNYNPLKTTPFGNQIIADFTSELIKNENLGDDDFTDLLTVVFSSMDYENGSFGPASLEMEDTYLRLDQNIADLISTLEKKVGKENLVIFLTANTSASYPVDYLKQEFKLAVGDFNAEGAFALLNSLLNLTFGDGKWIEDHVGQQVYFNRKLIEKNKTNLEKMIETATNFINQFEGVKVALTAQDLQRGETGAGSFKNLVNSYNKKRSGDFVYELEEGWQPAYKYNKVNYTDQTHVPLVFYGSGVKHTIIPDRFEAIDLVPTLSELTGIPFPDRCEGSAIKNLQ
jgi:predicted AlkP superfamily pyrophosphatase or phosphodiesterase